MDLFYTVDSEYKQNSQLQSICTETSLVTASLMVHVQSLQVTLEIILPLVLLQITSTPTYIDGKGIISSTVKKPPPVFLL